MIQKRELVGNKAKGEISERVFVRVRIRGKKCPFCDKIWRALFSWNTSFEIRPFTLLPTISAR